MELTSRRLAQLSRTLRAPHRSAPAAGSSSGASDVTVYRTVRTWTSEDGIRTVEMHRPEVLNARNALMYHDLITAFEAADADDSVLVVVLTGSGRGFCSGADQSGKPVSVAEGFVDPPGVAEVAARFDDRGPDSSKWSGVKIVDAFIDLSKPLVCAVNGIAVRCPTPTRPLSPLSGRRAAFAAGQVGEGFSSTLHADLVYASDVAEFWAPFARIGVIPEFCAPRLLPKRVGKSIASEMLLLSKRKTARELCDAGFVNEVLPSGDGFLPAVYERIRAGLVRRTFCSGCV